MTIVACRLLSSANESEETRLLIAFSPAFLKRIALGTLIAFLPLVVMSLEAKFAYFWTISSYCCPCS